MSNRFITVASGIRTLISAISSSLGVTDANKIVSTNSSGRLDQTLLPTTTSFQMSGSYGFRIFEEFIYGLGTFSFFTSGTGASVSPANSSTADLGGRPGICQISTGTTATGVARLGGVNTDNVNRVLLGFGYWEHEILLQVVTLRTTAEEFLFQAGFSDNQTISSIVDGILFTYTASSNNWQIRTVSNSVSTVQETSVVVVAGAWVKLGLKINNDATQVDFFIDGINVGTITTNIPRGANRQTLPNLTLYKTAGTSNRLILVDYYELICIFTTSR